MSQACNLEDISPMINWIYFPKINHIVPHLKRVVNVFESANDQIDSHNHTLESNAVLHILENQLIDTGFDVELSKKKNDIIKVPVLFGLQGKSELAFKADAYTLSRIFTK
jgi:hypothetical protein